MARQFSNAMIIRQYSFANINLESAGLGGDNDRARRRSASRRDTTPTQQRDESMALEWRNMAQSRNVAEE